LKKLWWLPLMAVFAVICVACGEKPEPGAVQLTLGEAAQIAVGDKTKHVTVRDGGIEVDGKVTELPFAKVSTKQAPWALSTNDGAAVVAVQSRVDDDESPEVFLLRLDSGKGQTIADAQLQGISGGAVILEQSFDGIDPVVGQVRYTLAEDGGMARGTIMVTQGRALVVLDVLQLTHINGGIQPINPGLPLQLTWIEPIDGGLRYGVRELSTGIEGYFDALKTDVWRVGDRPAIELLSLPALLPPRTPRPDPTPRPEPTYWEPEPIDTPTPIPTPGPPVELTLPSGEASVALRGNSKLNLTIDGTPLLVELRETVYTEMAKEYGIYFNGTRMSVDDLPLRGKVLAPCHVLRLATGQYRLLVRIETFASNYEPEFATVCVPLTATGVGGVRGPYRVQGEINAIVNSTLTTTYTLPRACGMSFALEYNFDDRGSLMRRQDAVTLAEPMRVSSYYGDQTLQVLRENGTTLTIPTGEIFEIQAYDVLKHQLVAEYEGQRVFLDPDILPQWGLSHVLTGDIQ